MKLPSLRFGRGEREVLDGVEAHTAIVQRVVGLLDRLIALSATGRATGASFGEIAAGEREADAVHRSLSLKIAEGSFFGGVREDLLALTERIDDMADSAKEAAGFLSAPATSDPLALELLDSSDMRRFSAALVGAASALCDLVHALRSGRKAVLAQIHRVETFEEEADMAKSRLLTELFAKSGGMNPVIVVQLRDFILAADDVADNAEDASDLVLVVVAKGYV